MYDAEYEREGATAHWQQLQNNPQRYRSAVFPVRGGIWAHGASFAKDWNYLVKWLEYSYDLMLKCLVKKLVGRGLSGWCKYLWRVKEVGGRLRRWLAIPFECGEYDRCGLFSRAAPVFQTASDFPFAPGPKVPASSDSQDNVVAGYQFNVEYDCLEAGPKPSFY